MRLTFGSLGAFTKYPVSASARSHIGADGLLNGTQYIGIKKYGFFEGEVSTFDQVAGELGLPKAEVNDPDGKMIGHWWRRHPLAFLMEAADDICYNVMDLEDAYLSGDVGSDSVISLLKGLIPKTNKDYPEQDDAERVSRHRA